MVWNYKECWHIWFYIDALLFYSCKLAADGHTHEKYRRADEITGKEFRRKVRHCPLCYLSINASMLSKYARIVCFEVQMIGEFVINQTRCWNSCEKKIIEA